jgi:hypothetical protein
MALYDFTAKQTTGEDRSLGSRQDQCNIAL